MSVFGVILVRIFPAFNRIRTAYGEILRISPYSVQMWENVGKMRTRITPNMDTFYAAGQLRRAATSFLSKTEWHIFIKSCSFNSIFNCQLKLYKLSDVDDKKCIFQRIWDRRTWWPVRYWLLPGKGSFQSNNDRC